MLTRSRKSSQGPQPPRAPLHRRACRDPFDLGKRGRRVALLLLFLRPPNLQPRGRVPGKEVELEVDRAVPIPERDSDAGPKGLFVAGALDDAEDGAVSHQEYDAHVDPHDGTRQGRKTFVFEPRGRRAARLTESRDASRSSGRPCRSIMSTPQV